MGRSFSRADVGGLSEMMVANGPGTDRYGPWIIERAIRDARDKIGGLPVGFSFR